MMSNFRVLSVADFYRKHDEPLYVWGKPPYLRGKWVLVDITGKSTAEFFRLKRSALAELRKREAME